MSGVRRFGLAWNGAKTGHILGASEDMTICHWYATLVLYITNEFNAFKGCELVHESEEHHRADDRLQGTWFRGRGESMRVLWPPSSSCFRQDVDWNPTKEDVFASVGDDKMLLLLVHRCGITTER